MMREKKERVLALTQILFNVNKKNIADKLVYH